MVNPLWNRHDGRLRAGWRIVALLAATTLASLVAFRFVAPLPFISPLGARVAYLVLAFLALWAAVRFLDRRPLRDLGLVLGAGWRRDLLAGFAVTGLVISLITVSFWSLGWVTLEGGSRAGSGLPFGPALVVQFLFLAGLSVYEEALCRGYLIRNPAEGLNLPRFGAAGGLAAAFVVSSILFGLMHAGNPNAGWIGFANLTAWGRSSPCPFSSPGRWPCRWVSISAGTSSWAACSVTR